MIERPPSEWTEVELDRLVADSRREGVGIDFKRDQYAWNDKGTKEFLADVSSFANARGGVLLVGIDEEDGCAAEVVGLGGSMDGVIQLMTQKIQSGIEPRVSGFVVRAIPVQNDRHVVVLHIPKSWVGPHMVTFKNTSRFYSRTSAGKYQLDVSEIRTHFEGSTQMGDRIREFRLQRISDVVSGATPAPMRSGASLILHAIPVAAFGPGFTIDLPEIGDVNSMMRPIMSAGWSWRLNFDGLATYTNLDDGEIGTYVQLFRNGVVEAVDRRLLEGWNDQLLIPGTLLEQEVISMVGQFRKLFAHLGLRHPIAWLLSLVGVEGYAMAVSHGRHLRNDKIDRDVLLVPELIQEDEIGAAKISRALVDPVWQACGWERSPNFAEDGTWKAS